MKEGSEMVHEISLAFLYAILNKNQKKRLVVNKVSYEEGYINAK